MKKYILSILTLFCALQLNAQCEDTGNYWNESWVSCTTSPSPNPLRGDTTYWLLYDFEQPQFIDTAYFWNANRAGESGWGAKDVAIDYSIDGNSWVELGLYEFPQAPETDGYEGFQGPDFDSVFVEKILISILSTHDSGSCASIAEVQFHIDESACYGIIDDCGICDGPGAATWYVDADMDGLGDPNNSIDNCIQPPGYVENNEDLCDNGNLGWAEVAPLFADNGCMGCHDGGAAGGLDLRSYSATAAGGNICGTDLLTGTKLVDIINISSYDGCGTPISFPSMNDRAGGQFDASELAQIQAWIDGGAPELCTDFCVDLLREETVAICIGEDYTFPDGMIENNVTADLVYTSNLISLAGCDSIVTTNLEVQSIFASAIQVALCSGDAYTFPDGSTQNNITLPTTQTSNLQTIAGCDSLITTNILVNESYDNIESIEVCAGDGYTFPDGTSWSDINSDASYVSNLQSIDGCDSIVTTELLVTINDTTVSVQSSTLTANATAATYQWLDCGNNFEVIPGASDQTFSPSESGAYAVVVTQDGCVDTSSCRTILLVGISKVEEVLYGLRPNPVREVLYITGEIHQVPEVTIYNALGQLCLVPFDVNDLSLDVDDLASGVYFLKLRVGEEVYVMEFVKQW